LPQQALWDEMYADKFPLRGQFLDNAAPFFGRT
jgi:hypothetical protein